MKRSLLVVIAVFCFGSAFSQLVYSDVAPIFYNRCTPCHHVGGGAPFPLMTYSQTYFWGGTITNALNTGMMPPWQPDTNYTRFIHERIITANEKQAILDWVAQGTLQGDTTQAPPPPVYGQYGLNGTPTMVLQIPTYTSTAVNNDIYNCFALPTNLTQDRYLRAFEIIPGNGPIVHHVVVTCDTTGTATTDLSGGCYTQLGQFAVGTFAQGTGPSVFPGQAPLKVGMRIKAGSKLCMQIHYPAGSAGQQDSTKIRLYFYPQNETGVRPIYASTPLQNWNMALPPNQVTYYNATYGPLPLPISIFSAMPHSHLLGKTMLNYAYTTNDTIPLIKIDNWKFDWEQIYVYRFMKKVPANYTLFARHGFDNTSNNPNNPNSPPQWVFAGTATSDEMLFDGFQWLYYLPGDENIDIGNMLDTDSLLAGINAPLNADHYQSYAYPNPSSEGFNIGFTLPSASSCYLTITDISGRMIFRSPEQSGYKGANDIYWDGRTDAGVSVTPGLYIYSVHANGTVVSGRIIRK